MEKCQCGSFGAIESIPRQEKHSSGWQTTRRYDEIRKCAGIGWSQFMQNRGKLSSLGEAFMLQCTYIMLMKTELISAFYFFKFSEPWISCSNFNFPEFRWQKLEL